MNDHLPDCVLCRCIAEDWDDLMKVFYDPGCFGDCSMADAAATLASEFIDDHRWQEGRRLATAAARAEEVGDLRLAGTYLETLRKKLLAKWGIVPIPSVPILDDDEDKRDGKSRWPISATKAQVADDHLGARAPQAV